LLFSKIIDASLRFVIDIHRCASIVANLNGAVSVSMDKQRLNITGILPFKAKQDANLAHFQRSRGSRKFITKDAIPWQ